MSNLTIIKMLQLQKHRGPDDSGVLSINTELATLEISPVDYDFSFNFPANLIMGFNRLSILDLSINGHQPMISEDGKVVLMMNGEIYNAFDFKNELISKGFKFRGSTDTEIVLYLYIAFGMEGMLKRLNGMFAIAIYDYRVKKLFLARDRFGIKPLYILKEKGRLAFSSEMKSFRVLSGFRYDLDQDNLNEFLLFRNVINDTLFKNVTNCTPGTYISIDKNGLLETTIFYNINDEGNTPFNKMESIQFLEQTIKASVNRQMVSDVKLGCQLSGGVDSSLITSYAAEAIKKGQLETVSIIFKEANFSEDHFIDYVTEKLAIKSHKYELKNEYYFNVIDKATWHFEQPLNHPNSIGLYLLSERAKEHVTVLLSGEGSDETLAGYSHFINTIKYPFNFRYLAGQIKINITELRNLVTCFSSEDYRMIMGTTFGSLSCIQKIKPDFNFNKAIEKRYSILSKLSGDPLLKQRKYEIATYLPDLLMRQDKMSMAHSIENRVPFLDNEMVSTALNIPGVFLVNKKNGRLDSKILLKELCTTRFDEKFAFRKKMGFGIPLRDYMSSQSFQTKWISQIEPGIKSRGIFEVHNVSKWVKNISKASVGQIDAIWIMTSFEIWAQQYFN